MAFTISTRSRSGRPGSQRRSSYDDWVDQAGGEERRGRYVPIVRDWGLSGVE